MLKVKPLKKYDAPDYPTKESASGEMLAGLPLRWKKNKKVLVCMGMIGAIALTGFVGCRNILDNSGDGGLVDYVPIYTESEFRHDYRFHHGGSPRMTDYVHDYTEQEALGAFIRQSELFVGTHLKSPHHGGAAFFVGYVLNFTEQEALDIIKRETAVFGINLTEAENIRSFEITSDLLFSGEVTQDVSIRLSDEKLGIEIAYLHTWLRLVSEPFGARYGEYVVPDMVRDAQIPRNGDAVLGVFIGPSSIGSVFGWADEDSEVIEERLEGVRELLIMQVHDFIEWLKQEGILQP